MADLGTLIILPGIKTELLEDTAAFSSMGAEHTSWCGQSFIPSGAHEGAVRSPITCAHLQTIHMCMTCCPDRALGFHSTWLARGLGEQGPDPAAPGLEKHRSDH